MSGFVLIQAGIQATGRDEKGRKQYIYHPGWAKARECAKYNRLLPFARPCRVCVPK